ncbi:PQQ-binding-like beta-propeller repeat protein [Altererythrobacter salegens]|uniref:PQQ-binding-like beta-propeller repeat protein n=1 Tax=Croceibacterium salegens TaxID=1737568 RepID=A0A6I4SS10_9SPHN|nr:PQQ-binding-like beta-propeller repeat protein [Croceibacterium salegens]MXO58349.1 PQQ-binding-like beta-propeller repeat protein [Croceibacterium salegens]
MNAKTFSTVLRNTVAALALAGMLSGCAVFGGKDKAKTPTVGNRQPILSRIATTVTPDPSLAGVSVVVPPPQVNTDFAQAAGSATKATGNLALSATPTQVWSTSIAGTSKRERLAAAPVIGGGMLYVVDTNGAVQAFDAATGSKRWTYQTDLEKDLRPSSFGGGVSYADGKVYATSGAGDVVKLDATTGAEEWRTRPAGPLRGSPTVAFNAVYAMTQDNQIFSLAIDDGRILWQDAAASGESGVFGVAAPAAGQGTVIAGYSTGEIVAYRYENGRTLWSDALARTSISTSVSTLTDVDADPIIDNGRVYALGQGGRMAAYELVTGQRIWELSLAGISTPVVAGEWIFTLTDDARLLAIARSSGKARWITQLMRYKNEEKRTNPVFWTGPVLAGNRLWIGNTRGELKSVDVMTGEVSDFAEFNSGITLPPIVANQTLYILEDNGKITAYR